MTENPDSMDYEVDWSIGYKDGAEGNDPDPSCTDSPDEYQEGYQEGYQDFNQALNEG